jgi:hypothetical protein
LDRVEDAIDRIIAAAEPRTPDGRLVQGELSSEHFRYLAIREYAGHLRRFVERIDRLANAKPPSRLISHRGTAQQRASTKSLMYVGANTRAWHDLRAAQDFAAHLADLQTEEHSFGHSLRDQLTELIHESSLLQAMSHGSADGDRCLVWLRSPATGALKETHRLFSLYRTLCPSTYGFVASDVEEDSAVHADGQRSLLLEMPGIAAILAVETGTHVFTPVRGNIVPVQVIVTPIGEQNALDILQSLRARDHQWRKDLARGAAAPGDDPFPLLPVLRLYDSSSVTVDLRSGLVATGYPTSEEVRKFVLSQLPLAAELRE